MPRFLFAFLLVAALHPSIYAQNLQQIGHLSYAPLSLAGCWHYVDSTAGEWALVGTSAGLSIVDVNDPTHPTERFTVPGPTSNWREVKTWAGYAYFGSEALNSGITIVDLRSLPDTIRWKVWRGNGVYDSLIVKSHAVLAQDGYLYIFGGASLTNGAVIASLSDPWNPVIKSQYVANYVHDGFVRGDTLWTSEIYKGQFGVVDISDKNNPALITTQHTPGAFNHNTGLSDNSRTLFTTDEVSGAVLGSFDVSNLDNIQLIDKYSPSKKPSGEVHNVRVHSGDFLVCPSYRGQLTIVDASKPDNLIEIAWDSLGTSLVWDADPYLPSGTLFATAKSEGLFVYKPVYKHAAWLQGTVTDVTTGAPLANAKVFVLSTANADTTGANGQYKTGAGEPGSYTVRAERAGYMTKVLSGITLNTGAVTTLNIALSPGVGTHDLDNDRGFHVFPTVFEDVLNVEMLGSTEQTQVQLTDFSGKLIFEQICSGNSMNLKDLKGLPAGQYLVNLVERGKLVASARVIRR